MFCKTPPANFGNNAQETYVMEIGIEYCANWHYTDRAVSLAAEILKEFEPKIKLITLIPAGGGKFEVTVGQNMIYSKLETLRHANPGEVVGLVRNYLKESG